MKKIISLILISMLTIICLSIKAFATTNTNFAVELIANKTKLNRGDTVEVSVKIKDLTDVGEGINAFMGTLEYDTNVFETVTKADMKAQNGWDTPEYNEENGKVITVKGDYITEEEVIFTINLKVKDDATFGETILGFKEPEAANDNDYIGESFELNLEIVEKQVENPDTENPNENDNDNDSNNDNNNNDNNQNNDDKKEDNTVTNQKLPYTGKTMIFIAIGLIILSVISIISYISYRRNNVC